MFEVQEGPESRRTHRRRIAAGFSWLGLSVDQPPFSGADPHPRAARAPVRGSSRIRRRACTSRWRGVTRPMSPYRARPRLSAGSYGRARRSDPSCAPAPAEFGDRFLDDQFEASLPRRICTDGAWAAVIRQGPASAPIAIRSSSMCARFLAGSASAISRAWPRPVP